MTEEHHPLSSPPKHRWRKNLPPPSEWQTVAEYAHAEGLSRKVVDNWIARGKFPAGATRVFPADNRWRKCRMIRAGTERPRVGTPALPKVPERVEQLELSIRAAVALEKSEITVDELTAHTPDDLLAKITPAAVGSGSRQGVVNEVVLVLRMYGLSLRSDGLAIDEGWGDTMLPLMTPKRLKDELVSGLSFATSDNSLWRKVGTRNTVRTLACFYAKYEGHDTPAAAFLELGVALVGRKGSATVRKTLAGICSGAAPLDPGAEVWTRYYLPLAKRVLKVLQRKIARGGVK